MKKHILALVLTVVCISLYAVNPIKEGNMISGHVIVKGTEENIPYATILIKENGQGTVSNEEGQFEFRKLPAGKYTLRVSAVGYKTQEKEVTVSKDFTAVVHYNPQIQISAESETKRSIFREKDKTKRSKKESAQHSKSRNKSFVMTSVSAL